jgi:hypothetical protein
VCVFVLFAEVCVFVLFVLFVLRSQSRSGFTAMILGMAAAVVRPTHEFIEKTLTAVTVKDLANWVKRKLGLSVLARRRLAFRAASNGTKTG